MKPQHHQVPVIRIKEIIPHTNADTLEIIPIEGFQVVVKKEQYKVGDLAYYIYPDSVVPVRGEYKFLWEDKILPGEEPPLKYRRISARRFRKEWSEGLLMTLPANHIDVRAPQEGDDLSDLLGITHYDPPEPEDLHGLNERGPKSAYPKSFKGWLYYGWYRILDLLGFDSPLRGANEKGPKYGKPFYDIENYKNHTAAFEPGEAVWVSEKIHGCQGKFVYEGKHMYAGSRRLWKSTKSKCIWRKCLEQNSWIEQICRENEGYTLYGEVFPCQGDKFMYGCKPGEVRFQVFDVLTPEHTWMSIQDYGIKIIPADYCVPVIYAGGFDEAAIKKLVDRESTFQGQKILEGVVVKPEKDRQTRNIGRLVLKLISNKYLEKV